MNRAVAVSTVIAILATFFALYGAFSTSSNLDEIGSLQWDVGNNRDAIESLQWEVENLRSTLGR